MPAKASAQTQGSRFVSLRTEGISNSTKDTSISATALQNQGTRLVSPCRPNIR